MLKKRTAPSEPPVPPRRKIPSSAVCATGFPPLSKKIAPHFKLCAPDPVSVFLRTGQVKVVIPKVLGVPFSKFRVQFPNSHLAFTKISAVETVRDFLTREKPLKFIVLFTLLVSAGVNFPSPEHGLHKMARVGREILAALSHLYSISLPAGRAFNFPHTKSPCGLHSQSTRNSNGPPSRGVFSRQNQHTQEGVLSLSRATIPDLHFTLPISPSTSKSQDTV